MKTLYLVRHAKSDHEGNLPDIDRTLNTRGNRDAYRMSEILKAKKLIPDLVISSPATRALSTALIFCRTFKYDLKNIILNQNLYETGVKEYMDVISAVNDKFQSIMIFGHNPTITILANQLTVPFTENVPTCGIVSINNSSRHWKNFSDTTGELALYDFPKNHSTVK